MNWGKTKVIENNEKGYLGCLMLTLASGLVSKMLTNANKGTYLVKIWQKYANVIYERSLIENMHSTLTFHNSYASWDKRS